MKQPTFLLFAVLLFSTSFANAQEAEPSAESEVAAVQAAINLMFDGMRAGDSTMVASSFHEGVMMGRATKNRDGDPYFHTGDAAKFLEAVGTPHDEIWNEVIYDVVIQVDGRLATAWVPYTFYLGETLSHCGTNAMQFFKTANGWKLTSIVDTARREGCPTGD